MTEKDRDDGIIELTEDELSEMWEDDACDSEGEYERRMANDERILF